MWLYGHMRARGRREELPTGIEQEAGSFAAASRPISLALAWYYVQRDPARAASMARRFAELAAAEHDRTRLARYEKDVLALAPLLLQRCGPETAARVESAMTDRFLLGSNRSEGSS